MYPFHPLVPAVLIFMGDELSVLMQSVQGFEILAPFPLLCAALPGQTRIILIGQCLHNELLLFVLEVQREKSWYFQPPDRWTGCVGIGVSASSEVSTARTGEEVIQGELELRRVRSPFITHVTCYECTGPCTYDS